MEAILEEVQVEKYEAYKDSGVEWLGEIPEHWEVRRSKFLFAQRKEFAKKNDVQLSATQAYGVIPQNEYEEKVGRRVVKIQFNLDKRKHVEVDDFVISMRSFQGGLERAWSSGCIRSSYIILKSLEGIDAGFYSYLFKSTLYINAIQITANFIRDGQDLTFENFSMVDLPILPLDEQIKIARFLDQKTAAIDKAINIKEEQIELLKERRQILIHLAVTRGLNPGVPMKDSIVDWIGLIPEHWEVEKGKWLFEKQSRPARAKDGVITAFRDGQVTLRSNRREEGFTFAIQEHGYQGIRKGDLVIHAMDAFAGAIGVSDSDGKSSPVYTACIPHLGKEVNPHFYAYLLRNLAITGFIESLAKGIRERSTDFRFKDFGNLPLSLPPLVEQNEIVDYLNKKLNKIELGIQHSKKEIEKLKEYKATLINSAVTGKIKVI